MNGRPSLVTQRARHVLRARGYDGGISWENAQAIFAEYVGYYFQGQIPHALLSALADELLLALPKHDGIAIVSFFDVLLATATVPSVWSSRERADLLRSLQQFYAAI